MSRRRTASLKTAAFLFASLLAAWSSSARGAAMYATRNLGRYVGPVSAFADEGSYLAASPDTGAYYLGRDGGVVPTDGLSTEGQLTAGGRLLTRASDSDSYQMDRVREPDGTVRLIQGLAPGDQVLGINDNHQVLVERERSGPGAHWRVTVKTADDQWRIGTSGDRVVVSLDRGAWTDQERVSAFGPNGEVGVSRIGYIPPNGRGNYYSSLIHPDGSTTPSPKGGYEGMPSYINRNGEFLIRWSAHKFLNDEGGSVGVDGVSQLWRYYNADGSDFLLDKLLPVPGSSITNAAMNLRGDLLISADVPGLGLTTYQLDRTDLATPVPVPEPASWAVAATLLAVGTVARRRGRRTDG